MGWGGKSFYPLKKERMFLKNDWGDWNDIRHFIAQKVDRYSDKIILEVASGKGFVTEKCKSEAKIFSFDISHDCLKYLKSRRKKNRMAIQASIWNMPFPDTKFDIVLACHCFPFWDFPCLNPYKNIQELTDKFINALVKKVAKNGKIIITTVNGHHWFYRSQNKTELKVVEKALHANNLQYKILGWRDQAKQDYGRLYKKIFNKTLSLVNRTKCTLNAERNFENLISASSKAVLIEAWKKE